MPKSQEPSEGPALAKPGLTRAAKMTVMNYNMMNSLRHNNP